MILTCPACRTRYVVPDTAVGAAGRQVRCAQCKNSWFQEPARTTEAVAAPVAEPPAPARARTTERSAQSPLPDPPTRTTDRPSPLASKPFAPVQPVRPEPEPVPPPPPSFEGRAERPLAASLFDQPLNRDAIPSFRAPATEELDTPDEDVGYRPRRNPAKLLTIGAVVAAVVMLLAALAIYWFGLPNIGGASLSRNGTPLVLEVTRKPERQRMESGNELLAVSGRIVNPTDTVQRVPQINAELRDAQGRVVYQWSISAPVAQIGPKQAATFNSAEVDVPQAARAFNVHFAEGP